MTRQSALKCPRCEFDKQISVRICGDRSCDKCGQRWTKEGVIIPSSNRLDYIGKKGMELLMSKLKFDRNKLAREKK